MTFQRSMLDSRANFFRGHSVLRWTRVLVLLAAALAVFLALDAWLAHRVARTVDALPKLEQGQSVTLTGLEADLCNALTGQLWIPAVWPFRANKAMPNELEAVSTGGCIRHSNNSVTITRP
jgi:hypothetical protein